MIWVACLAACMMVAPFIFTGGDAVELAEGRQKVIATITKAKNYDDWKHFRQNRSKDPFYYRVKVRKSDYDFQFETIDGLIIKGSKHAPEVSRDRVVGEKFPVWYAISNPQNYELSVGHKERNVSAWHWLAGFFALLAVLTAILVPLNRARKMLAIRDTGNRCTALVVTPNRNQIEHQFLGDHLHWKYAGLEPQYSRFEVPQAERPAEDETITVYHSGSQTVWENEVGAAPRFTASNMTETDERLPV